MPSGRGLALGGAGALALLASRGFGTPALAVLGAGLVALAALAAALVILVAAGTRPERLLQPARCRAGEPVTASVRGTGWAVRLGLDRLVELSIDPAVGALGPAERVRSDRETETWRIGGARRGEHLLPPASARVADPFGLMARLTSGRRRQRVTVLPRAPELTGLAWRPAGLGRGAARVRREPGWGELEGVRDYRPGDPLSRVHWGQTAKRGRLQTKEMWSADSARHATLVLLDAVEDASAEGLLGEAPFETAVTAAAAIARHLDRAGVAIAFAHTGAAPLRLAGGRARWPAVERALAAVRPDGRTPPSLALRAATSGPAAPEVAVLVTAAGDAALPAASAGARADGVAVVAVLVGEASRLAESLARAGTSVVTIAAGGDVVAPLEGRALGAGAAARERAV